MLGDEFDCDQKTILTILHEAGLRSLKSKWVPHDFTMDQQTTRFEICLELSERYRRGNLDLQHIVTCDENSSTFLQLQGQCFLPPRDLHVARPVAERYRLRRRLL
ncbi:hypothetical protein KIN20_007427 [Parelaphostrongylus tenuis]|uniref:Histone-lysine N-methyltransferase SETMAR n=1 Tax=Parelaphostrongylus tenuis TaxID=148309 RepID=A0AAD5M6J8_PARTN|nr:hypothetical protein KIN20_007427 [Parelaphostrongylus tenuis]